MVTKESLQTYADTIFAGLSPERPKAELNLNKGGIDLIVGGKTLWFDANLVNSDMENAARALRDELYPPVEASEVVTADEPAAAAEAPAEAPATDPAPPLAEEQADPFPAEQTKPSKPPKPSKSER